MKIFLDEKLDYYKTLSLPPNFKSLAITESGEKFFVKDLKAIYTQSDYNDALQNLPAILAVYSSYLHKALVGDKFSAEHHLYKASDDLYYIASKLIEGKILDTKIFYTGTPEDTNGVLKKGQLVEGFTASLIAHEILKNADYDICFVEPDKKLTSRKAFSVDFDLSFNNHSQEHFLNKAKIKSSELFEPKNLKQYFKTIIKQITSELGYDNIDSKRYLNFSNAYLSDLQVDGALKAISKNYKNNENEIAAIHNSFEIIILEELKKCPSDVYLSAIASKEQFPAGKVIQGLLTGKTPIKDEIDSCLKNINKYLSLKDRFTEKV